MPRLNHNAKVANRAAAAAAKFVEMHNVDENEDDILQDSETSPGQWLFALGVHATCFT